MKNLSMEQIESEIKELLPTYREFRQKFKELDSMLGLLYTELGNRKRADFEKSPGITKVSAHGPGKKPSYEQTLASAKNMNPEQLKKFLTEVGLDLNTCEIITTAEVEEED